MADMASVDYVASTEENVLIDQALAELHNELASKCHDLFLSSSSITVTAGTASYSLPADFLLARQVMLSSGGYEYPLTQYAITQKGDIAIDCTYGTGTRASTIYPNWNKYYKVAGTKLWVYPKSWSGTVVLYYVPMATAFAGDSTNIPDSYPLGSESFIIARVAAALLAKEESDPSFWIQEASRIKAQLVDNLSMRAGGFTKIVDCGEYASGE